MGSAAAAEGLYLGLKSLPRDCRVHVESNLMKLLHTAAVLKRKKGAARRRKLRSDSFFSASKLKRPKGALQLRNSRKFQIKAETLAKIS